MNIKCRVNFVEETGMVMEKQAFRLMVMKNQVFGECRVNFIEETVVVMKNQVFREYRVNYDKRAGVKIDGNEESSVQKV